MFTSIILAWLAVLFAVLSILLFVFKRTGNKKAKRFFSKIHIVSGILLVITGIVHGLLAGNPSFATFSDMTIAPALFTLNWGTASLVVSILLGLTFVFRKKLKKLWIKSHRVLTLALVACVAIHVLDVGIQIDDRISAMLTTNNTVALAETTTTDSTSNIQSTETTSSTDELLTQSSQEAIAQQATSSFSGATIVDGIYQGTATGYSGNITVEVTVDQGVVTEIEIISQTDTPSYFSRAQSIVDTIVDEQTLEVDAVSGATYSSAGIVNAVENALENAISDGEIEVTEFTYSQSHHGGGRH